MRSDQLHTGRGASPGTVGVQVGIMPDNIAQTGNLLTTCLMSQFQHPFQVYRLFMDIGNQAKLHSGSTSGSPSKLLKGITPYR
jgi:hypothetical protein